jgi:hypothetical protein
MIALAWVTSAQQCAYTLSLGLIGFCRGALLDRHISIRLSNGSTGAISWSDAGAAGAA